MRDDIPLDDAKNDKVELRVSGIPRSWVRTPPSPNPQYYSDAWMKRKPCVLISILSLGSLSPHSRHSLFLSHALTIDGYHFIDVIRNGEKYLSGEGLLRERGVRKTRTEIQIIGGQHQLEDPMSNLKGKKKK